MCGLAGVLLANHTDFINPSIMFWTRSGDLIVMAVLGGMGTVFGPVIGAIALLVLEEAHLVPHAVLYMRAEVKDLISRVVVGRGAFDYWESGLDLHFGQDMYESFVRYQSRLIQVFDNMAEPYGFQAIDASQSAEP